MSGHEQKKKPTKRKKKKPNFKVQSEEKSISLQDLLLHSTQLTLFSTPKMDVEFRKSHVPAFGSWDCNDDLPFTQCFESARQAGLLRYSYSDDRDLYVAGDLYQNDVVTPAMIVVPRRRAKAGYPHVKEGKKEGWVVCECECDYEYDVKEPPSPVSYAPPRKAPKAVDEDLYKISPDLLYSKSKRKRGFGLFSCCLRPTCDM